MDIVNNPTADDLVKLGYRVVLNGELAALRKKINLSRNAQANLIGVNSDSLAKWEKLHRGMHIETAQRIGEWWWGAQAVLAEVKDIDFTKLICGAHAAQYMSIPTGELEETISRNNMRHERLGVLGIFVYRNELGV